MPKPIKSVISLVLVGEEDLTLGTFLGKDANSNDSSRRAIPLDGLSKRCVSNSRRISVLGKILTVLDKQNTLLLGHVLLEVLLTETVNVRGSTACNGVILLVQRTTKRYAVHLASVLVIIASHNNTCGEVILVVVAQLLKHGGCDLRGGVLVVLGGV